ncbi:diacylglycerol/lipid kinase family protein [Entomobacter blattae]|uniref:Diacylglycerol kinase catalytic domain protein n=1 Tax=Entomobacter blattae TaxID=2762277 RepID=A0A7H1NPA0_9PROT|nr:acylglycerol kinase family protein [Entomobacter blattae]QNT77610.1 Diacylglycerol kinase catalytic domain protein [Entomobacter blattae]
MSSNFALIRNPRSRKNVNDPDNFRKEAQDYLGKWFVEPPSRESIIEAVQDMSRQEVDCIAVDGGDGTVSDVLTAIYHAYDDEALPAVAILPSGNTNLIASDVGFGQRGLSALKRLEELCENKTMRYNVRRRHALGVRWSDPARPAVLGMFHGMAAYTRAIEIAHKPAILDHFSHEMAVAITLASAFGKLIFRKTRDEWMKGEKVFMAKNQENGQEDYCFLFLSTTLNQLTKSIWPFWNEKEGGIHYLKVKDHPPHLLAASAALLTGRSPAWLRKNRHYDSGTAHQITLKMSHDFVLDGEVMESGADGITHLFSGPLFDFIQA